MEMIKTWSFFLEGDQFSQVVSTVFFSDKTIKNPNPTVVRITCQGLNRIYVKNAKDVVKDLHLVNQIVQNSMVVIDHLNQQLQASQGNQQTEEALNESMANLYNLLGFITASKALNSFAGFQDEIMQECTNKLVGALQQAKQ
jgi:hypothetical protein